MLKCKPIMQNGPFQNDIADEGGANFKIFIYLI